MSLLAGYVVERCGVHDAALPCERCQAVDEAERAEMRERERIQGKKKEPHRYRHWLQHDGNREWWVARGGDG